LQQLIRQIDLYRSPRLALNCECEHIISELLLLTLLQRLARSTSPKKKKSLNAQYRRLADAEFAKACGEAHGKEAFEELQKRMHQRPAPWFATAAGHRATRTAASRRQHLRLERRRTAVGEGGAPWRHLLASARQLRTPYAKLL